MKLILLGAVLMVVAQLLAVVIGALLIWAAVRKAVAADAEHDDHDDLGQATSEDSRRRRDLYEGALGVRPGKEA